MAHGPWPVAKTATVNRKLRLHLENAGKCEDYARRAYREAPLGDVILVRLQMLDASNRLCSLKSAPDGANALHAMVVHNSRHRGMFVTDPTYFPQKKDIPMEEYLDLLRTAYVEPVVRVRLFWAKQWCPKGEMWVELDRLPPRFASCWRSLCLLSNFVRVALCKDLLTT